MPLSVLLLVLCAAAMNATWNTVIKGAADTLLATVLVGVVSALISAAILPFVPAPAPASWPFIAASVVCQVAYCLGLAASYRAADMSEAYPVMRGCAPLVVAVASSAAIGEALAPAAWGGVLLISGGVLGMARTHGGTRRLALPLANAGFIAAYTMIDGLGVRRSGAPLGYALWLNVLVAIPLAAWAMRRGVANVRRFVTGHLRSGVLGGFATTGSYAVALWAMTHAPVAVVAALRETSMLFAIALSATILKERVAPGRIVAALFIAAGAAALRLA